MREGEGERATGEGEGEGERERERERERGVPPNARRAGQHGFWKWFCDPNPQVMFGGPMSGMQPMTGMAGTSTRLTSATCPAGGGLSSATREVVQTAAAVEGAPTDSRVTAMRMETVGAVDRLYANFWAQEVVQRAAVAEGAPTESRVTAMRKEMVDAVDGLCALANRHAMEMRMTEQKKPEDGLRELRSELQELDCTVRQLRSVQCRDHAEHERRLGEVFRLQIRHGENLDISNDLIRRWMHIADEQGQAIDDLRRQVNVLEARQQERQRRTRRRHQVHKPKRLLKAGPE